MKYTILIDNVTANRWSLNIQESYVFAWIYNLPSWAKRYTIDGVDYYFGSRHLAIKELPLLTSKPDTMYRYYKKLEEHGLIKLSKVGSKDVVSITDKGKKWNSKDSQIGVGSENNPSEVGKSSDNKSENNPTNKTTSIDLSLIHI